MTKKKNAEAAELATIDPSHTELAPATEHDEAAALAELSSFFGEGGVDGLEDVDASDIRLAAKVWNMPGLADDGRAYPKDVFYDTLSEKTQDTIDCALLLSKKTFRYDEFDNAQDKTVIHCESRDRRTGTMTDGSTRPCGGCPDAEWFRDEDGKPYKKCGEVHNVVGVELDSGQPFATKFKKTGLKPFRTHLSRHHIGAMRSKKTGRKVNVPMYFYAVELSLKLAPSGKYAVPVFEKRRLLDAGTIAELKESAEGYHEMMAKVMDHVDAQQERFDGGGGASVGGATNADDFADEG